MRNRAAEYRSHGKAYQVKRRAGLSIQQRLFESAKYFHRYRGLEFSLTLTDIIVPEYCPVLGIKLATERCGIGMLPDDYPTLDRMNNTRGYIPGNVHVISWRANQLKRDATLDEIELLAVYMRGQG